MQTPDRELNRAGRHTIPMATAAESPLLRPGDSSNLRLKELCPHSDQPDQSGCDRHDLELLMEIPICILVADLSEVSATIREVNRRAELVYGYTAEELVGMPAANLVPEDARAVVLAILERVRQGQR